MSKDPRNHDTPNPQSQPHLDPAYLPQFTGTTRWFKYASYIDVLYTDGIHYLAEKGEAYWLIDKIVWHLQSPMMQDYIRRDPRLATLQFWNLTVAERRGQLICKADAGGDPVITQFIKYTNFPLAEIDI